MVATAVLSAGFMIIPDIPVSAPTEEITSARNTSAGVVVSDAVTV